MHKIIVNRKNYKLNIQSRVTMLKMIMRFLTALL
jgi:hypothetical protein